jgi:hypothetical protein
MNFGSLSGTDKTDFLRYQNRRSYHSIGGSASDGWTNQYADVVPSCSVWVGGFDDIDEYVLSIRTDRPVENERGQGFIAIGRAWLTLDNSDQTFYGSTGSNIEENARIRIMLGYNGLNIPAFSGVVRKVSPGPRGDRVYLDCADYFILMYDQEVSGSMGADNTPELIAEEFCNRVGVTSNIGTGLELDVVYNDPSFETKNMLACIQEMQNSVFHVCVFDEEGVLQMYEREYINFSSDLWGYDERNIVTPIQPMADSQVINEVWLEYEEGFLVKSLDQRSIDDNGQHTRTPRILITNSEDVSTKFHGRQTIQLEDTLEGFRITSAAGTSSIDCVQLMLAQDGDAVGEITVKIYSDSSGPDTSLVTSLEFPSEFLYLFFVWESFYFTTPLTIDPATNYWVVIDTGSVSAGTVYIQASRADATALYAYNDGSWNLVNNVQPLHRVLSSRAAQTVADDIVRYYREPRERLRVTACVGVPQVQLMDDIYVDISAENATYEGKYIVERVQHRYTPYEFTTTHTMKKHSEEGPVADDRDALQNWILGAEKTLGDELSLGELILLS